MTRTRDVTTTFDRFAAEAGATGDAPAIALTIAHHPDVRRVGEIALLADLDAGKRVELSRVGPPFAPPGTLRLHPLDDPSISRQPIVFTALEGGGVRVTPSAGRTRLACGGVPLTGPLNLGPEALKRGAVLQLGGGVVLVLQRFGGGVPPVRDPSFGLVGESEGVHRMRGDIGRVANLAFPVLIRGETGTGKELVARGIHDASARRAAPFVAVNLGAIPAPLAASELFGAERGAYTGAVKQRGGYFEAAQGGTLFLDEIGEAPPDVQVMLLRVLETGETQPVGGQKGRKADVRVLAATDADLDAAIRAGTFRAPLFHRLSALEIRLPPLRERRDDIARLLVRFLAEKLTALGEAERLFAPPDGVPWLPAEAVARLVDHDWPGNVRQLRNVARQLVVSGRGRDRVEAGAALERLLAPQPPATAKKAPPAPLLETAPAPAPQERRRPADVSEPELRRALRESRWDLSATADRLGIARASIYVVIGRVPSLRTARDVPVDEIVRAHAECGGDVDRIVDRLEVSERAVRRRLRELGLL